MPAVKDQINNDTLEKFCYNNDPSMCDIYGGLYQWKEAMQYSKKVGVRGICPVSWHIPAVAEFNTLRTAVNGDGYSLKQVGQGGGTNTSGFSALLAGVNQYTSFSLLGNEADFWGSDITPKTSQLAYELLAEEMTLDPGGLINDYSFLYNGMTGFSVRCIKDTGGISLQSPYGGESWQVGSKHNISWGGGNLSDTKLRLEYSTDNGLTWLNILDSVPAQDGSYSWIIPNIYSKKCKVKITDLNDPNSISISDSVFTIYTSCPGGPTVEHGGKTYNTVLIGNQCWLKENINIGTMIPGSQESTLNGTIEKYCYNDDTANCTIYGGLYKYTELSEGGICPTFWHVDGLYSLADEVIYDGNSLKAIGQGSGFGIGTDISGFSALLAGYRSGDGTFIGLGNTIRFPFSAISPNLIMADYLDGTSSYINRTDHFASAGSVRCLRNESGPLLLKSPKGGESWQIGTTQYITWTLSDVINIKIDYTTNNGTSWINLIASTPTSTGSYQWTIPNTPSTNCKVKINSVNNPDTNSISNVFSIYQIPINPCPGIPTVNYAGQKYNTIAIGDQCWMRENLNIGTMIDSTQNQTNNGIIEKYCYNNDTNNCSIYGGLYQWNEAMQYSTIDGAKGICPTGWHIPKWSDLSILKSNVGNNSNALKELGQGTGSGAGTNSSGFSALLSGINYHGSFNYLNVGGDWWTSTIYNETLAYNLQVANSSSTIQGHPVDIMAGYSIRCINDSSVSALPVELISFTASIVNNKVILNWNTATEINCLSYEVERKTFYSYTWQIIASIQASGNINSPRSYSYIDKNVNSGNYNYRLRIVDVNGTYKYSSIVDLEMESPAKFELEQNYPNPWNPTTTIRYQVPVNIMVTIKVFDVLGKEVSTLVNEVKPAGNYEVILNGHNLASGIYYYQMKSGNFIDTKKIILIK
jgi:uncharacterized protein (TIGR02145 family)